jgi:hypothetical protein
MTSCSECDFTSDNQYKMCPPKMADGRHFTDYTPRCGINLASSFAQQQLNSYDLRQFMINNADQIMLKNRDAAIKNNSCGPCVQPWNQGTMLQEQNIVKCTASTCSTVTQDPYGLGQGRDYGIVPDQQFISRMSAENDLRKSVQSNTCVKPSQDKLYFPFGGSIIEEEHIDRVAIPGGGMPYQ